MKKIIFKVLIIILFSFFVVNFVINSHTYAKYCIIESLEAININIKLKSVNEYYEETQKIL